MTEKEFFENKEEQTSLNFVIKQIESEIYVLKESNASNEQILFVIAYMLHDLIDSYAEDTGCLLQVAEEIIIDMVWKLMRNLVKETLT
jgi:hypothetical protein